jgi:hypothetical protein
VTNHALNTDDIHNAAMLAKTIRQCAKNTAWKVHHSAVAADELEAAAWAYVAEYTSLELACLYPTLQRDLMNEAEKLMRQFAFVKTDGKWTRRAATAWMNGGLSPYATGDKLSSYDRGGEEDTPIVAAIRERSPHLAARYADDVTVGTVARRFGVSQATASKRISAELAALRADAPLLAILKKVLR